MPWEATAIDRHGHAGAMLTLPLTDGAALLRLPDARDGAAVYNYGQDPDVEETAWLPIPFPCPRDVADHTIQEFQKGRHGRFGLTLVIAMPPNTELRGVLHLAMHTSRVGEISYGVAPRYRRLGLATRAITLAAAWAFTQVGLERLEIVVTAPGMHGLASRRAAENAGFAYQGMQHSQLPATGQEFDDPLYALAAPGT